MLLKHTVSPTTPHYTASLKHLPLEEIVQPWILIQLYEPEQKRYLKEWFGEFHERARALDVETDARRVLNYMIRLGESDRLRFQIKDGKLNAKYISSDKEHFYMSDLEAASQLTIKDELN